MKYLNCLMQGLEMMPSCRSYLNRFAGAAILSAVRDGEIKKLHFSEDERFGERFGAFHSPMVLSEFEDLRQLRNALCC